MCVCVCVYIYICVCICVWVWVCVYITNSAVAPFQAFDYSIKHLQMTASSSLTINPRL